MKVKILGSPAPWLSQMSDPEMQKFRQDIAVGKLTVGINPDLAQNQMMVLNLLQSAGD